MPTRTLKHLAPARRDPVSTHPGPNNAFIGACHDFDDLIAKLEAARTLHFGFDTDRQRNWAEAGSVAAMNEKLAEALAFITGTAA
jgi:hypothetical protein